MEFEFKKMEHNYKFRACYFYVLYWFEAFKSHFALFYIFFGKKGVLFGFFDLKKLFWKYIINLRGVTFYVLYRFEAFEGIFFFFFTVFGFFLVKRGVIFWFFELNKTFWNYIINLRVLILCFFIDLQLLKTVLAYSPPTLPI